MSPTVEVAAITAAVTMLGWVVSSVLTKRREKATQQLERTVHYLERQIEEFYGPLFNLVHQVVIANHVLFSILSSRSSDVVRADAGKVREFFQDNYFFPLHQQINEILKSKLYLIEGTQLPEPIYQYLRHAAQERAQALLWRQSGIDTSYVAGLPYPNELYDVIKGGLDEVMQRYSAYNDALRTSRDRSSSVVDTELERKIADSE